MRPGVVPEMDTWHLAAFRPGDRQGEPLLVMTESLFAANAPPELADGDFATPERLKDLRGADLGAGLPA